MLGVVSLYLNFILFAQSLSYRFNKNGEFAVIISPTDQGYYEPDTSSLLRLKVEQEYGYGSAMGEVLTDKVNLLGSGALPFWRWLEGNCRTPAGLGKIQANFEKFLIDGRTGKPLRRYPRKYQPYDIADDMTFRNQNNFTLNHFQERINIYNTEQFNYEITKVKLR